MKNIIRDNIDTDKHHLYYLFKEVASRHGKSLYHVENMQYALSFIHHFVHHKFSLWINTSHTITR